MSKIALLTGKKQVGWRVRNDACAVLVGDRWLTNMLRAHKMAAITTDSTTESTVAFLLILLPADFNLLAATAI